MLTRKLALLDSGCGQCRSLKIVLDFLGYDSQIVTISELKAAPSKTFFALIHEDFTQPQAQIIAQQLQQLNLSCPILAIDCQQRASTMPGRLVWPLQQQQLSQELQCLFQEHNSFEPETAEEGAEIANRIIGQSRIIRELRATICKVAQSDVNVLILGESGTGKEVVARALHQLSNRSGGPFVPVNCGAIPSELLESELFGHEKGAFTGAISARKGRFELAIGGTIFLDEIGDMPLAMQVKILRILQERCFERVGSNKSIQADVRVVAATHRNLELAVREDKFREDLYYRLNVLPIEMPAVRQRIEDLPLLIADISQRLATQYGTRISFSEDALATLSQYAWPGNIRELANLVERMMVLYSGGVVDSKQLPNHYRSERVSEQVVQEQVIPVEHLAADDLGIDLKRYLMDTESTLIKQALEVSNGVVARAADYLGMRRTTLVEKMRKYDIKRPQESFAEEVCF